MKSTVPAFYSSSVITHLIWVFNFSTSAAMRTDAPPPDLPAQSLLTMHPDSEKVVSISGMHLEQHASS
jgi:hypothetical protein